MSDPADPATLTAPPAADGADWHRPLLRELAELAMDAARQAHRRLADHPSADPQDAGLLFTRLARAVRQTVALDARLAAPLAPTRAAPAGAPHLRARRADLRRRLTESLRDADPSDVEALLADLDDRLDHDPTLADTPAPLLIGDLCDEWGLRPNLSQWSDEDLACLTGDDPLPPPPTPPLPVPPPLPPPRPP